MRQSRIWTTSITLGWVCVAGAALAQGRKLGLWEITTNMTWQQSPMPGGINNMGGGPHTGQYCYNQALADRFGTIVPQMRKGCQLTEVQKNDHGMTATMVCSGTMSGMASVESSWSDSEHAKGSLHFVGTMQMGNSSKPVEWTTTSSAIFKSGDCGNVQPIIPESK